MLCYRRARVNNNLGISLITTLVRTTTTVAAVATIQSLPGGSLLAFAAAFQHPPSIIAATASSKVASFQTTTTFRSFGTTTRTGLSLTSSPLALFQQPQQGKSLSILSRSSTRLFAAPLSSSTPPSASADDTMSSHNLKFVDIGANLLDDRYMKGIYNGKVRHESDMDEVIKRAKHVGVTHIILTAGTLRESYRALKLVRTLRSKEQDEQGEGGGKSIEFGCTVGVHPTRCSQEFVDLNGSDDQEEDSSDVDKQQLPPKSSSDDDVLQSLLQLVVDGQKDKSVLALGEFGLDYDRLQFCSKETQQKYFMKQLEIFDSNPDLHKLPLFLHNRSVGDDLLDILKKKQQEQSTRESPYTGVVHSFDDTIELASQFIELGFYIGINGCSLKTDENLKVVKELPLDKILLETDCPYCEIKNTHSSMQYVKTRFEPKKQDKKFEIGKMVKGRNEPNQIIQVAEVIAGIKGVSVEDVASTCYENSCKLYGF